MPKHLKFEEISDFEKRLLRIPPGEDWFRQVRRNVHRKKPGDRNYF